MMDKGMKLGEIFETDGDGYGKLTIMLDFEYLSPNDTTVNKLCSECESFMKRLKDKYQE